MSISETPHPRNDRFFGDIRDDAILDGSRELELDQQALVDAHQPVSRSAFDAFRLFGHFDLLLTSHIEALPGVNGNALRWPNRNFTRCPLYRRIHVYVASLFLY